MCSIDAGLIQTNLVCLRRSSDSESYEFLTYILTCPGKNWRASIFVKIESVSKFVITKQQISLTRLLHKALFYRRRRGAANLSADFDEI